MAAVEKRSMVSSLASFLRSLLSLCVRGPAICGILNTFPSCCLQRRGAGFPFTLFLCRPPLLPFTPLPPPRCVVCLRNVRRLWLEMPKGLVFGFQLRRLIWRDIRFLGRRRKIWRSAQNAEQTGNADLTVSRKFTVSG